MVMLHRGDGKKSHSSQPQLCCLNCSAWSRTLPIQCTLPYWSHPPPPPSMDVAYRVLRVGMQEMRGGQPTTACPSTKYLQHQMWIYLAESHHVVPPAMLGNLLWFPPLTSPALSNEISLCSCRCRKETGNISFAV